MTTEIERKFLVNGEFKHLITSSFNIKQGYLSSVPERTVRIRIKDKKGFITIKGKGDTTGMERFEWEKEILIEEANKLLELCEPTIIEKIRYEIKYGKHIIEVDVFEGQNKGLILAEIELEDKDEHVEIPNWLGFEVTGDKKYYNAYLSKYPFLSWEDK